MQHDTQAILCHNSDCREKPNESHNALASNNTNQHLGEGDRCLVERADINSISTNKHDDRAQVDINSCNVGERAYRRKRRKTKPTQKVSGSVEGFPSCVPSVPDSSAGDSSLHNLDETTERKEQGGTYRRKRGKTKPTEKVSRSVEGFPSCVPSVPDSSAGDSSLHNLDETTERKEQGGTYQRKRGKTKPTEKVSGSVEGFPSCVPSIPDSSAGDSSLYNLDETTERKEQGGTYRRKRGKTKPTEKVSGSVEGFPSCVTSVPDSSAGDSSLHNLDETTERKEQGGTYRRKRGKTKPTEKVSGSVEGFPSCVTSVPDSSAGDSSLHNLDETTERKEQGGTYRRKRGKTKPTEKVLGSVEGFPSCVTSVPDSSAGDSSLHNLDETTERKERGGTYRRKRGKTKPTEKVLGSVEGSPSSVTSVPDSSAGDSSLHGCIEKMMGEVVGGHGTPFLAVGVISPEKASSECPNSKPAYREQEQKIQTENLEETINRQTLVEDVSHVGLPEKCFEKGNMDNLGVKRNAILDVQSPKEICHKSTTSNEVCGGGDPSVEKLESENLVIQHRVKDEMPSSLQLDDINSAVNEKGGLQQRLQLSPEGAAPTNLGKKLLVLDVNGLLADIVPYVSEGYTPDTIISRKAVFKRPFCDDFLQFCFEKFHVGVWSSRTKRNVESVLDFLMGKSKQNLLFCWDQSHCTDTGFNTVENRDKPLLLKELKKLWEKHESNLPWERGEYNESNTLLLDDSPYKALKNPRHTAVFPLSYQYKDVNDNSLGPNGDLRVYLEGLALADNVQKYVELNPFGQRPITETNLSWGFYLKVIGTTSSIKQEDDTECSGCHKDLRNDRANYYRN
ncbi:uncharacterized protein LOC127792927 isoform X2 [Diospyros lotus]|uniref:uncharacterized protein LOC127792927 isoform X2 n=1 Tax=Diospyros lotus TaxID=55363 RepID=UPI002250BFCB|nr:uncharacterized protein LOC127792927 isoform X2 [Diospyros lotus]